MKLDLSKLFDRPGEIVEFDTALDLSGVVRWGDQLFPNPVAAKGLAENRSGVVQVRYTADFMLEAPCDRCLTMVRRPERMEFSHTLVLSLNREDNDELIVIPDGRLDLAELCTADILLGLPTSILCDDGCLGLCPVCGKNLNQGDCGCDRKVRDARFDALRGLLAEEES